MAQVGGMLLGPVLLIGTVLDFGSATGAFVSAITLMGVLVGLTLRGR